MKFKLWLESLKLVIGKRYSKKEMIALGAGGWLSRGVLREIPLDKIDGLEPTPAGDYWVGRKIEVPVEVVYDRDNDKYILYAGNHRFTQAKMNNQDTILAFVEE